MTKDIGNFFFKLGFDLSFAFVFLAGFARHHEVALDQFPELFLELQDIPVVVTADAEFAGVVVAHFGDGTDDFADIHGGIIS